MRVLYSETIHGFISFLICIIVFHFVCVQRWFRSSIKGQQTIYDLVWPSHLYRGPLKKSTPSGDILYLSFYLTEKFETWNLLYSTGYTGCQALHIRHKKKRSLTLTNLIREIKIDGEMTVVRSWSFMDKVPKDRIDLVARQLSP